MTKKQYSEMTMDELDQAKYALDEQAQALKTAAFNLSLEDKLDGDKVNKINAELSILYNEKLLIQQAQDILIAQIPYDANAHTIGINKGVVFNEIVGNIGNNKKK